MAMAIAPTHSQMFKTLREFLLTIVPNGCEVIKFQNNRVVEPAGSFVMMSPLRMTRLSTNLDTDLGVTTDITQSMQVDVQLDFHAPDTDTPADLATVTSTLLRSWVSVKSFAASGYDITPLYASDPRQMPFVNAEQQYETRWVVDASLQVNAKTNVSN